jgi:glycosyltransferase involved in cell wall biosynthesis
VSPSVLVVARWYPSHDQPGRGTFVADLVRALTEAGGHVVVASFETTQLRPRPAQTFDQRRAAVEAAWMSAVAHLDVLSRPRSWAATGVPVARLPVVRTWSVGPDFDRVEQAERHAAILRPFALAASEREPFDVVHAHTGLPDGLAASRVADELGCPLLVTEHDSTLIGRLDADPAALAAYRTLLDGRRRVVAVSESLATALTNRLGPLAPIGVLPNPVPMTEFPLGLDAERNPAELLWVGARAAHKGTERLLRSFAIVRGDRPDLRLRMIGAPADGDDGPWRTLIEELGLSGAVDVEQAADRQAVAAAMRRAGLFVHPSPFETFGMVAAEALASGLPVVATPSGGVDGIVGADGAAGEIATSLEPEALAASVAAALARRSSFRPEVLRARVDGRFGAAAVAAATLETYRSLTGATAHRARPTKSTADDAGPSSGRRSVAAIAALRRPGLLRVAALPARILGGVTLVTGPAPDPELVAKAGGHVAAARAIPRRPGHVGRLVGKLTGRNRALPQTDDRLTGEVDAIRSVVGGFSVPAWIVAADGDDVEPIVEAAGGDSLAPGSIRWLADRGDERADDMAP